MQLLEQTLPHVPCVSPASAPRDGSVGGLVRQWRTLRKLSQMELALDINISPRHLSFVETGRAKPSAQVLMAIADYLNVPLRTRNTWLLAAGYAPRYSEQSLDSARMQPVRAAVQRLLAAHDPYPGIALDGQWNVVLMNSAGAQMVSLLPAHLREPTLNIFRASLHPEGFAAHTRNFAQWGSYLLGVLQRRLWDAHDEALALIAQEVYTYPNVQALKAATVHSPVAEPALLVPCELTLGGHDLSLFTTLTTFGSPRDITLHELCIELFYPADEATQVRLRAMAQVLVAT